MIITTAMQISPVARGWNIFRITPYTRDATFLFTSQIRNNLIRRVREWIVVS